jgi:hypothetical protein
MTKNNLRGHIGGNTLMEMAVAFVYKKPILFLMKLIPSCRRPKRF